MTTDRPTGPPCGNNPNYRMSDGDRAAVEGFRAYLAVRAEQRATETDEERADREETERDHARGDHTYCGITCEVELPTEHLRNFVIAKGYVGTAGALDELLRRARTEATAPPAPAERAAVLREAANIAEVENAHCNASGPCQLCSTRSAIATELRRRADEAQQAEPEQLDSLATECTGCGHTRNWHDTRRGICLLSTRPGDQCDCPGFTVKEQP